MERESKWPLKVIPFPMTKYRRYFIDMNSKAIFKEKNFEITDSEVIAYAISHLKWYDKMNPIRLGHAVLESWHILYEERNYEWRCKQEGRVIEETYEFDTFKF